MAKRIEKKDEWLKAPQVEDICSVAKCISHDFCDYIKFWKHNGWWVFDSPRIIHELTGAEGLNLEGMTLLYYEVYEKQYNEDKREWEDFTPEASFETNVEVPDEVGKRFLGYDIVTYSCQNSSECSPLSCNGMAAKIPTNKHCLLDDFNEARRLLESGDFDIYNSEPGPFRIIAVYEVAWCLA